MSSETGKTIVKTIVESLQNPDCWKVTKRFAMSMHNFGKYCNFQHRKCQVSFTVGRYDVSKWWQFKKIRWRAGNIKIDGIRIGLSEEEIDEITAAAQVLIDIHNDMRLKQKAQAVKSQVECLMSCTTCGSSEDMD